MTSLDLEAIFVQFEPATGLASVLALHPDQWLGELAETRAGLRVCVVSRSHAVLEAQGVLGMYSMFHVFRFEVARNCDFVVQFALDGSSARLVDPELDAAKQVLLEKVEEHQQADFGTIARFSEMTAVPGYVWGRALVRTGDVFHFVRCAAQSPPVEAAKEEDEEAEIVPSPVATRRAAPLGPFLPPDIVRELSHTLRQPGHGLRHIEL